MPLRRILVAGVIVAAVAAGAAAATMVLGEVRAEPVDARVAASSLLLQVDQDVTPLGPLGLVPGGRFAYRFRITNVGKAPVLRLAVRSEKVMSEPMGDKLTVLSVDDRSCWGRERIDCLIPALDPGQTRTIKVEAKACARSKAGDRLLINTFLGSFAPTPDGGIAYDVIGDRKATSGTFVTGTRKLT